MADPKEKLLIMVVDDDPSILAFFARLFGAQSSLSVALDAMEALRMLHHRQYNLIFLDVKLPKIEGVELLRDIKKLNPDAVVVMMSGYDVGKEIDKALEMGAQEFIPKPFNDIGKIMNIREVAEYLKLHNFTVYRLAQQGKIPFSKIGKQWRISRDLLEKWVNQESERTVKKE